MVRRTKEEALATRDSILDAAEHLFARDGVSRTSLQHIASACGLTRGAIYWHFRDKGELFNEMMNRATLPMEALRQPAGAAPLDPVAEVRSWVLGAFRLTVTDQRTRRVFEIATHKVEYVDELSAVRERHLARYNQWVTRAEKCLKAAIAQGLLTPKVSARTAARGLWALADGLIQFWLLDPRGFDLRRMGTELVDCYLDSLRSAGTTGRPARR
ncbi:MAG: TetR family transcriptional regulator [Methylibium sp.]|nr:TetR family transcriptional regulator [Methylibium sp.]